MRLNEVSFEAGLPVDGYGPGFFRIAGEVHTGPILVLPHGVEAWKGYDDLEALIGVSKSVDVVFVGTGAEIAPLPASMRQTLESVGLGVEMMSSPSACRTYNVLLSEGRRVGLALIPV